MATIEVNAADFRRAAATETDRKDRHVFAAALSARADYLRTENTRDFDTTVAARVGISLTTTAGLLTLLAVEVPYAVSHAHRMTIHTQGLPGYDILDKLSVATGPAAVQAIETALRATAGQSRLTAHGYPPEDFIPRIDRQPTAR